MFLLTCIERRLICIYDNSGWANVMEPIRIYVYMYVNAAYLGFLEEVNVTRLK